MKDMLLISHTLSLYMIWRSKYPQLVHEMLEDILQAHLPVFRILAILSLVNALLKQCTILWRLWLPGVFWLKFHTFLGALFTPRHPYHHSLLCNRHKTNGSHAPYLHHHYKPCPQQEGILDHILPHMYYYGPRATKKCGKFYLKALE